MFPITGSRRKPVVGCQLVHACGIVCIVITHIYFPIEVKLLVMRASGIVQENVDDLPKTAPFRLPYRTQSSPTAPYYRWESGDRLKHSLFETSLVDSTFYLRVSLRQPQPPPRRN